MKIDYLWHSEFIISMDNKFWNQTRILSDVWLSDYAVWDLMWRNPTFKIDYNKIWKIDWIYLSHSHTDHIDPYTLIELYNLLDYKPTLLVPETIIYLIPLFQKYLHNPDIIILKNKEEIEFCGINLQGFVFDTDYITNEDDVMGLFISNHEEIIFNEVDLVPPDLNEVHNYLYKTYNRHEYKNRVYIATRNELNWNLKILDIKEVNKRKKFASQYKQNRTEEIEYEYSKYSEGYIDYLDIYSLPNFHKVFIGQGITYPKDLNKDFLKMQIMTLSEEVKIETKFARQYKKTTNINFLEAGDSYIIGSKKFENIWKINYLQDFNFYKSELDFSVNLNRIYYNTPIFNEIRDVKKQETIILELINNRFLPYRFAIKQDCIKSVILHNQDRNYNILIKFWTWENFVQKIYQYNLWFTKFILKEYNNERYDESYWANDLDDFNNGVQELYSNFLHNLDSSKSYRLWMCLWANYINNDLVYKKFEFHFCKALEWKTSSDFVLPIYGNLENQK